MSKLYFKARKKLTGLGCLAALIILSLWGWAASTLFAYDLKFWIGKDIPWYGDLAGGLVSNAFIIPATIITWILSLCGVPSPVFHIG